MNGAENCLYLWLPPSEKIVSSFHELEAFSTVARADFRVCLWGQREDCWKQTEAVQALHCCYCTPPYMERMLSCFGVFK